MQNKISTRAAVQKPLSVEILDKYVYDKIPGFGLKPGVFLLCGGSFSGFLLLHLACAEKMCYTDSYLRKRCLLEKYFFESNIFSREI